MSMLKAIRDKAHPHGKTNIVNGDIKIVETTDGADGRTIVAVDTSPQDRAPRVKFKPIDSSARAEIDAEILAEAELKANPPPSSNFDLVGDDMGASPAQRAAAKGKGRMRLYPNDAARQQAYRDRKKTGG